MQNYSEPWGDILGSKKSFENGEINLNNLSNVITEESVAAAGINVYTPIVSAIIGNLRGTLPRKKKNLKEIKCKLCNCIVSSNMIYQRHVNGAKHQKKVKELEVFRKLKKEENRIQKIPKDQPVYFTCDICPVEVNSATQLQNHLAGEKHKRNAEKLRLIESGEVGNSNEPEKSDRINFSSHRPSQRMKKKERHEFSCSTCNIVLNSEIQLNEHMNSKKHKMKEELKQKVKPLTDKENPNDKYILSSKNIVSNNPNSNQNLVFKVS